MRPIAFLALLSAFVSGTALAATATSADRAFVFKVSQGGMFVVVASKLA